MTMKTLDEVIKGFECCKNIDCNSCPYKILFNDDSHVPCDQFDKDEDALHYLKEYQSKEGFYNQSVDHMVQMINEQEDRVTFYLAEMNKNEPLTWDELKTMLGKPVWVEYNLHLSVDAQALSKAWFIIFGFQPLGKKEMMVTTNKFVFTDYEQGSVWKAYRKERE